MIPRLPCALSFDLDDTLWSGEEVLARAERALYEWLEAHYPRITETYDLERMKAVRHDMARASPVLAADLTRLRRESLRWHAREAGYPEDLAEAGVEVFLSERHAVSVYPDVVPLLERLRASFPLVALTNGNANVYRTELGEYFDLAISAADVGVPKPHPSMFRRACRKLSVRTGDLLHIGDDPLRDVHAARGVGARAVWVNRNGSRWPEDLRRAHNEIETLADLPRCLGIV